MISAPCPILERYKGVLTCNEPYECDSCGWMHKFLDEIGGEAVWVCTFCLSRKRRRRTPLGFYTSGECDLCGKHRIALQVTLL